MLGKTMTAVGAVALILVPLMTASCTSGPAAAPAQVTSLTIFPVTAMGGQHQNMAEVVGLLVEKTGFREIKIATEAFKPEADAEFQQIAEEFGGFVASHPIATDYALYCEIQASEKREVRAVREVLVDRNGTVIWTDVQTPQDRDFRRVQPENPMTCCMLVSTRLEPLLVKASAEDQAEEGPMARLWASKSGVPPASELEAMKARQITLGETGGNATMVVFPARMGKTTDQPSAERLVSLLNEKKLCRASLAGEPLWFDVAPSSNQQKVLWDTARAFQNRVRAKTPAADYALYADYIVAPDQQVWAVHVVVCDAKGEFVIVDFQNDHHEDFQAVSPQSLDDCSRLAARRLAAILK